MKTNKQLKNILIGLATTATIAVPIATTISCGDKENKEDPQAATNSNGGEITENSELT